MALSNKNQIIVFWKIRNRMDMDDPDDILRSGQRKRRVVFGFRQAQRFSIATHLKDNNFCNSLALMPKIVYP